MQNKIPSLNGLRAISIIMVINYHFSQHGFFSSNKFVKYGGMLFSNGPLGVGVFFIISGFLITTLLVKEDKENGYISLKGFYFRRIIRIFPAYYFLLLVYFVLQVYGYFHLSSTEWISSLTFTRQFSDGSHETAHLWSLSVEELFYLVWPFLFIKIKNLGATPIIVLICTFVVIRMLSYSFPIAHFTNTILSQGDGLLIGCLLAVKREEISAWVVKTKKYFGLSIFLILISIMINNYLYSIMSKSANPNPLMIGVSAVSYGLFGNIGVITSLLVGYIILASIYLRNSWFAFLNTSAMDYIGKLSYSIYLWQQLFSGDNAFMHSLPLPVSIVCIGVLACMSYYLVEKPFLKIRKRLAVVESPSAVGA